MEKEYFLGEGRHTGRELRRGKPEWVTLLRVIESLEASLPWGKEVSQQGMEEATQWEGGNFKHTKLLLSEEEMKASRGRLVRNGPGVYRVMQRNVAWVCNSSVTCHFQNRKESQGGRRRKGMVWLVEELYFRILWQ